MAFLLAKKRAFLHAPAPEAGVSFIKPSPGKSVEPERALLLCRSDNAQARRANPLSGFKSAGERSTLCGFTFPRQECGSAKGE